MRKHRRKNNSKFQWMKYVVIMAIFAILAAVLAIYFMPFVAYYRVESAIIMKDASGLASHTDLNEMRRNLKKEKGQRIIKHLKHDDGKEIGLVDVSIKWAALSSDQAIDRAISTEGFYIILSELGVDRRKPEPAAAPPPEISPYQMIKKMMADGSFHYRSFSKFEVNVKDGKGRYVQYFSFIFVRDGLNWRLTNVTLPLF